MAWITIRAYKLKVDSEELVSLGIEPKDREFEWTDTAIRTEDIQDITKMSEKRLVMTFYDERPLLIAKEDFTELLTKIDMADYDIIPVEISTQDQSSIAT